jgi:SAM-dependent methyltransferase
MIGAGRCEVCGHVGSYRVPDRATRETHECESCGATLRYRVQAAALTATYGCPERTLAELAAEPPFRGLSIYEPGIVGPFRKLLHELPGYVNSYYWPDVRPGDDRDGVRCEDLRSLTFPDESFDLVISSDVFEHVRGPMEGFSEIHRVLRRGGHHVFTVPLFWPLTPTTEARVDYSGPEDRFIKPPRYHGSPVDPEGSLVYTDFGMDLPDRLRALGFVTTTHHGYENGIAFVSRKPAVRSGEPSSVAY